MSISVDKDKWWEGLSDHERCIWAARVAAEDFDDVNEVVYAVEKPWKFKDEAWMHYVKVSEDAR